MLRNALVLAVTAVALVASVATSDAYRECDSNDDCVAPCERRLPPAEVEPRSFSLNASSCEVEETVVVDDVANTAHIVSARPMCTCDGDFTIKLWSDDDFCFREGRDFECLLDARELDACTPGDAASCDDACDVLAERLQADNARVISSSLLRARCGDDETCSCAFEVEGRCRTFSLPGTQPDIECP